MKTRSELKILVVEPDSTARLQMQNLLSNKFKMEFFDNGREAVLAALNAAICFEPYDLIFMEIVMPEMEGCEVLRQIRENEESLGFRYPGGSKIIITTASKKKKDVKNAFYFLCDAYLVKPILENRLMDELRRLDLVP